MDYRVANTAVPGLTAKCADFYSERVLRSLNGGSAGRCSSWLGTLDRRCLVGLNGFLLFHLRLLFRYIAPVRRLLIFRICADSKYDGYENTERDKRKGSSEPFRL